MYHLFLMRLNVPHDPDTREKVNIIAFWDDGCRNYEKNFTITLTVHICLRQIYRLTAFSQSNMVNIPKLRRTFCKGKTCRKHTVHKVSQYKSGRRRTVSQGRRRYGCKQEGYGGQTRPIFHKKSKVTKKIVLKMECSECHHMNQVTLKRTRMFQLGGEKKQKDALEQW